MLEIREGKSLQLGQMVKVYRNLTKKCYSIADAKTGIVLAYADYVSLRDVKCKVSEAGRQRVIKQKKKYVHAFMVGSFQGGQYGLTGSDLQKEVSYNPYKFGFFYDKETGKEIQEASLAHFTPQNVKYL